MTKQVLSVGAILAVLLECCGLAWGQAEYRLAEHLGCGWTDELISFPVKFPEKACRDIRAVTADAVPVVFQTPAAEIVRHPDGSVASARVYVKTNLAPSRRSCSACWTTCQRARYRQGWPGRA